MLKNKKWYCFVILGITAILYMLVYFHRVSTSAIADDLIKDISLTTTQLGTISSVYFVFYAISQPFIGILSDKVGARTVILCFLSIAVVGCVGFGFAYDFWTAIIARSLIGIGVSGIFVPSLKLHAEWFKPERFARVNGIFIGIGNSGALIATTPLAFLALHFGWREVFYIIAGITFFMLLITTIFLFDKKNEVSLKETEKPRVRSRDGIKTLIKMKNFWLLVVIFFATFGAFVSFQGLWATKYMTCLLNIGTQEANNLIMFIPIGVIVGALMAGFLSDKVFYSRAMPLRIALIVILSSWILITIFPLQLPIMLLPAILFLLGVGGGTLLPLVFVIIKDKMPKELVGTSLGFINPSYFFGIFSYQIITGLILDVTAKGCPITPYSYYIMMLFCLITLIVTTILGFFIDETFPTRSQKGNK